MTPLEQTQYVLDQRGYIVIATYGVWHPGEVMPDTHFYGQSSEILRHPLTVIAKTDRADFLEQAKLIGHEPKYRVVAE
jgi:hypothetical protein